MSTPQQPELDQNKPDGPPPRASRGARKLPTPAEPGRAAAKKARAPSPAKKANAAKTVKATTGAQKAGPPGAKKKAPPATANGPAAAKKKAPAATTAKERRAALAARAEGTTVIAMLVDDHQEAEDLVARLLEAAPGEWDDLSRRLVRSVSVHAAVEEQVLYPATSEALGESAAQVDEALAEHREVKELLDRLEGAGPGDAGGPEIVRTLAEKLDHHVVEEETEMFPRLLDEMSKEALESLGRAVEVARLAAPTRPHPEAPDRFPANVIAGVPTAVVDRAKDVAEQAAKVGRTILERLRSRADRDAGG